VGGYPCTGRFFWLLLSEGNLLDSIEFMFTQRYPQWLGKSSFLDDLASLDPDLYHGLLFLKRYPGNPEDLSLNFTVAIEEFGLAKSVDLIPDGSNIPVTAANRLEYIVRMSHFRLTKQIKRQSEAFFSGLSEMINPRWLRWVVAAPSFYMSARAGGFFAWRGGVSGFWPTTLECIATMAKALIPLFLILSTTFFSAHENLLVP